MPLPLPNLDDRKWADLVDEGRALIPFYAPEWTDHNVHDPGITLIELFACLVEMDIYQLNRIPERHRRKFLALAGIYPEPPKPAKTVLSFSPAEGTDHVDLPAFVEFQGKDPFGETTHFLTQYPITIVAADLDTIQVYDGATFRETKKEEGEWSDIPVFGSVPKPCASIYFGFSEDLSKYDGAASLYFKIAGPRKDSAERIRIIDEAEAQKAICNRGPNSICREDKQNRSIYHLNNNDSTALRLEHHSVRTVWEYHLEGAGPEDWQALYPEHGDVFDDTRAFTLDGRVVLKIPRAMKKEKWGKVEKQQYYVRCRFYNGAYDASPVIQTVAMNAVPAEQAIPVEEWKLSISADATVSGTPPERGGTTRIRMAFDQNRIENDFTILHTCTEEQEKTGKWDTEGFVRCLEEKGAKGIVRNLSFEPEDLNLPELTILEYQHPKNNHLGLIILELAVLGKGDGSPLKMFVLDQKPAVCQSFKLLSLEKDGQTEEGVWNYVWREWGLRHDLDASGRVDFHYTLEPTEGEVNFGDGERGRIPPEDSWIVADYRTTRAEAGNLSAHVVDQLTDSSHNRSALDFEDVKSKLEQITNPLPTEGGTQAETLTHAQGRAVETAETTERAVTLTNIEQLAMQTPGTELARVSARANLWANLPCLKAPGIVTIVVMPNMPVDKPVPSPGLLCAVKAYLNRRRIIGMRLNVVGPSFREVEVHANVRAFAGTDKTELPSKIITALNTFLDPRTGSPDGKGWPFGRDVYRSEILQVIDEVEGVDHVQSLELIADGGEPQCGNVSLCPTELVTPGAHEIKVI